MSEQNARRQLSDTLRQQQQQRVNASRSPQVTGNYNADLGRFEVSYPGGGKVLTGQNQVGSQPTAGSLAIPAGDRVLIYQQPFVPESPVSTELEFFGETVDQQVACTAIFRNDRVLRVTVHDRLNNLELWTRIGSQNLVRVEQITQDRFNSLNDLPFVAGDLAITDNFFYSEGGFSLTTFGFFGISPIVYSFLIDPATLFSQFAINVVYTSTQFEPLRPATVSYLYQGISNPATGVTSLARVRQLHGDMPQLTYTGAWAEFALWGVTVSTVSGVNILPPPVPFNARGTGAANYDRNGRVFRMGITNPSWNHIVNSAPRTVTEFVGCEYDPENVQWVNCVTTEKQPLDPFLPLEQWAIMGYPPSHSVYGFSFDAFDDLSQRLDSLYNTAIGIPGFSGNAIFTTRTDPNGYNFADNDLIVIPFTKVCSL